MPKSISRAALRREIDRLGDELRQLRIDYAELHRQLDLEREKAKQDLRFAPERRHMLGALTGMAEAVSKAIIYTVGKEQL